MVAKVFDRIEQVLALVALSALVVAVLFAGIGRSIGLPIIGASQYAQLALIWACMLGADIAVREGRHIRVSLLFDVLPTRIQAVFSLIAVALILMFLGFVAWYGWFLAIDNWERELGASGLPYGLVTLALPVGGVLLAISFLRRLFSAGLAALFDDLAAVVPEQGSEKEHRADIL
ncbi:TRAP transporter small permease [Fulvimarina sp. MAC3]|uniref:TRAP transporter small permease n=1 Tax=Fulvimarina sp. MAC3 TaxID=3148887 RepID=UPI0031FE21A6